MERDLTPFLSDCQAGHSDFQVKHFILGKNADTPYGEYKQACREIKKRVRGLKDLAFKRKELVLDMEDANTHGDSGKNTAARKSKAMADLMRDNLDELDAQIIDTERELALFADRAAELKAEIGDLTPALRDELEADMWTERLRRRAAAEILAAQAGVSLGTMETIMALPEKARKKIVKVVTKESPAIDIIEPPEAAKE